jgi:hypothetical protein
VKTPSQLASDPQNSFEDNPASMEDRLALRNAFNPGQTLVCAATGILTMHTSWAAVEIYGHEQRDLDAQIEQEMHDYERRCRTDPPLTDHQSNQAGLNGTSTPKKEVGAPKTDDPAMTVSPSGLS